MHSVRNNEHCKASSTIQKAARLLMTNLDWILVLPKKLSSDKSFAYDKQIDFFGYSGYSNSICNIYQ